MVRGVKCDYSLQSLVNKNLIEVCGRKDTLGRPFLYRTTDEFLSHFGISSIDELPEPDEKANEEPKEESCYDSEFDEINTTENETEHEL